MKQTVYLETTIISYLAAKPSRDIIVYAHQQITQEWWENIRPKLTCYVSPFVIQESEKGDGEAVKRRIKLLSGIPVLELHNEIQRIAEIYFEKLNIPDRAKLDAVHLAVACFYKMDYLLSWNCKHIVSARTRKNLEKINNELQLFTPVICTPEELNEV